MALIVYSVAHFGHLLTLNCSNFTKNGKRLKQAVNSEGEKNLELFSKELKVVLLYSIKTVVSQTKGTNVAHAHNCTGNRCKLR